MALCSWHYRYRAPVLFQVQIWDFGKYLSLIMTELPLPFLWASTTLCLINIIILRDAQYNKDYVYYTTHG